MSSKIKMTNFYGNLLYEGPLQRDCFRWLKRYDDPDLDEEHTASRILHQVGEDDLTRAFIDQLESFEYLAIEWKQELVWTMK